MSKLVVVVVAAAIVVAVAALCVYLCTTAAHVEILERRDGDFDRFATCPTRLSRFYAAHRLKPIDLAFVTTEPYAIKVRLRGDTRTLSVPAGYVTDGVSRPIKSLPIPNEDEGAYWVYHDFMYQRQRFDDGTPITKRQADDIMHKLITGDPGCRLHARAYRLFVNVNNGNDTYWRQLGERGTALLSRDGRVRFVGRHVTREV